jgi:two-component system, OmpR family, response regulator ChvI
MPTTGLFTTAARKISSAAGLGHPPHNAAMSANAPRIAVVEDDPPTRDQLIGWLRAARPDAHIEAFGDRDRAEAALARERFDLVTLDLELGRERHAGIALINVLNKRGLGTPVLVVSAMPASVYRSIMKALDAWDYLQKTLFDETEFIETVLALLRQSAHQEPRSPAPEASAEAEPQIDPLRQRSPTWRGQRLNLPLTAQRILATLLEHRGEVVSYDQLFEVVKSGRNKDNVRKHVATIRDALREIDPAFDGIENVPMRGFRWTSAR